MIVRMKLLTSTWIRRAAALNVCAIGVAMLAAVKIVDISINQPKDLFPESITSLKDGTIILGSVPGGVFRIKPGETEPKPFVAREGNGFTTLLGVLADENANTPWVCNTGPGTLSAFDLRTGMAKGSYPMPTGAVCNDIAVADNGTAYASDTAGARIFMLKKGATALEQAAADPLLAGADGLAFGDRNTLYVNSVTAGKLIRLDRAIAQARWMSGKVVFTDAADATSSGATGDSNVILKALRDAGYEKRVLAQIVDVGVLSRLGACLGLGIR